MDTTELIARAKAGDEAAVEQIFSRHWDMCVKAAYARVGDMHLAEDAAQEALITALTRLGELRHSRQRPLLADADRPDEDTRPPRSGRVIARR